MTLISNSIETLAVMPAIDPFYEGPQATLELTDPDLLDKVIVADLEEKNSRNPGYFSEKTELTFDNYELSQLAEKEYSSLSFAKINDLLHQKGTLSIPMLGGFYVMVNGISREVTIVPATELADDIPNHGDMSSMLYLRDHIQAAAIFMDLSLRDPTRYEEALHGHTLLFSALHLMSTPAQLERFQDVIQRGSEAGQADWPHISLHFNDMDAVAPDNKWRNKQDTFQMLAYTTLDALERGFIGIDELDEAHKQFLGSVVPFLASVGFPRYENSGSWEEIEACRTSVISIETALLHKMKKMRDSGMDLSFLEDVYNESRAHLSGDKKKEFADALDGMITEGLQKIGQQLPYESPDHNSDPIKYREADAALAYVLMYNIPDLLEQAKTPVGPDQKAMTGQQIEALVLDQLKILFDPETKGIYRYIPDSYQRQDAATNRVRKIQSDIKAEINQEAKNEDREIDLDKKQALRDERSPEGKQAAWIHQLGQISGYATDQCLKSIERGNIEEAKDYLRLGTKFLNYALSNITGDNQWHAVLGKDGLYSVQQVPPNKLPECKIAYTSSTGEYFLVPSPHTPLNWASATVKHAIGLLKIAAEKLEIIQSSVTSE